MKKPVIIWDQKNHPQRKLSEKILYWSSYNLENSLDAISIPRLIEKKEKKFRSLFLLWVHNVGQTKINKTKLVDHLKIRENFSYWWMTLFSEKCNYLKSPLIVDAIKIFALEELINSKSISSIKLVSSNKNLSKVLKEWCKNKRISFDFIYIKPKEKKISIIRKFYNKLPFAIRGFIWCLKFIVERWSLRGFGVKDWVNASGKITIVTYLFNLKKKIQTNSTDIYWTKLPSILNKKKIKTNWLHFLIEDGHPYSTSQVKEFILKKNKISKNIELHITIFSFLSFKVIKKTIKDYLFIYKKNINLEYKFVKRIDKKYLWHLFTDDWKNSIYGQVAFFNLLILNLFEAALNCLPNQGKGLYLQENQGWEFGFLNSWKSAGHKGLIGFPHSTVKFWDLRYFNDKKSYTGSKYLSMPRPDKIACNGPIIMNAYKEHGYPKKDLVKVEALRYLYINKKTKKKLILKKNKLKLLIIGDYLEANTIKLLDIVQNSKINFHSKFEISYKPHPACPKINLIPFERIKLQDSNERLEFLLDQFDIIFSSETTSAAVDAYCKGLLIITLIDGSQLNLSPLRNFKDVIFIENFNEFKHCLNKVVKKKLIKINKKNYFYLDNRLTLWNKLLLKDK